eukprot:GHVN01004239.1.p1 GENE.GHVN01004239.1~~GHVN01004239.1.p1  ORF type:complete len:107 (+),score=10.18 GHVN01004239.1:503-823(+)
MPSRRSIGKFARHRQICAESLEQLMEDPEITARFIQNHVVKGSWTEKYLHNPFPIFFIVCVRDLIKEAKPHPSGCYVESWCGEVGLGAGVHLIWYVAGDPSGSGAT